MLLRLALLLVLLTACDGPVPIDAGHDAGVDGGRADAGHDAGPRRDAGVDSGHDAGPTDPGWEPWATLDEADCTIERARYPERIPGPRWEPCAEQPVGCLRQLPRTRGVVPPTWFGSGRGYVRLGFVDSRDREIDAIGHTDGPTIAAWRTPPLQELIDRDRLCSVRLGLGEGYASVTAQFFNGDDRWLDVDWVFHAPIDAIGAADEPLAVVSPGAGAQGFYVSADLVAMWTGGFLHVVNADGRFRRNLSLGLSGLPQGAAVVGPHVLWHDWRNPVRIAHAGFEDAAAIFHGADPGDVKEFHTDGVEMAWLQGYDRQPDGLYARLELWAAPYVRDPADLEPRFVRNMDLHNSAAYGGGWYVMLRNDLTPQRLHVVRTSDGTLREWIPPPGDGLYATPPLYVSDHEMLVQSNRLVRIDPHTLPLVE